MVTDVVNRIKAELLATFNELFTWFEVENQLLNYQPANGGWSIQQILEHISLTNHYLLILITKGVRKSLEISKSTNAVFVPNNYDLDWEKLKTIGEHGSFEWNRPEHMEPKGEPSLIEIKERLEKHFHECLNHLAFIKNGEGVLYKTMMSVNNLGKIDVYHYIYFLVQHSKRHLSQMQKIKIEFNELYDR